VVVTKQSSRVERVRLRLAAAPVVSIKALPAAPLGIIELPERMKPAEKKQFPPIVRARQLKLDWIGHTRKTHALSNFNQVQKWQVGFLPLRSGGVNSWHQVINFTVKTRKQHMDHTAVDRKKTRNNQIKHVTFTARSGMFGR
jgi:hypothetical protein